MALTVSDIGHDADLFRMAYPHWPHPEPERIAPVVRPMLEIYGPGDDGSLIEVRSRRHMVYDGRDSRIAPWPALIGWANREWDWRDGEHWAAMYAGPYRENADRFAMFSDPAEAVRWIAAQFSEEY